MRNLWNKIKEWLLALPNKVLLAFIVGLVLSAFITLVIPSFAEWCIVPIGIACFIGGFVQNFRGKPVSWWLWLPISLGALIIQIFAWL